MHDAAQKEVKFLYVDINLCGIKVYLESLMKIKFKLIDFKQLCWNVFSSSGWSCVMADVVDRDVYVMKTGRSMEAVNKSYCSMVGNHKSQSE